MLVINSIRARTSGVQFEQSGGGAREIPPHEPPLTFQAAAPSASFHTRSRMASTRHKALGDELWKKSDHVRGQPSPSKQLELIAAQINAELFSLTYGALVVQLIKDYEDYGEVNTQLEKMYEGLERGGEDTADHVAQGI